MRIVLHMGQGKTGTTALQRALHAARGALAAHDILYPTMPDGAVAHHLLLALAEAPERIPPHVSEVHGGLEQTRQKAAEAFAGIAVEVARTRPEVLILSSETLLHGCRREAKLRLHRLLVTLSEDIQPVVYVREPAALYVARAQEKARVAVRPLPPGPQQIRTAIEETEAAFGLMPAVVTFDRARLTEGSIVADFITRFLSNRIAPAEVPDRIENPSLSAEAALLSLRFRALVAPDSDWKQDRRSQRLYRILNRLEQDEGHHLRPQLRPGFAQAIRRASVDYLWLRDRFDVTFPEIDYAAIDGAPLPTPMLRAPLEDIFEIDGARYVALMLEALRSALDGLG